MIEKKFLVISILFLLILPSVLSHDSFVDEGIKLKNRALSVTIVIGIMVIALIGIAIGTQQHRNGHQWLLFPVIAVLVLVATTFIAATTIYTNSISHTGGPVHWHADFEIWNCGEKVDAVDPKGLSNRVGTTVFHEHNDNRIHVEGVVVDLKDTSLGNFVRVAGGSLTEEELTVPTNNGVVQLKNGMNCGRKPGKVQVFVYRVINPSEKGDWKYQQQKIEHYVNYVLAPFSRVPPGDCIIMEFDEEKGSTDKICETYKVALQQGELHGS